MIQQPTRDPYLQAAIDDAKAGLAEGGIPIGSVLAVDGHIVGRGHNRWVQKVSAIVHAAMDAGQSKVSRGNRGRSSPVERKPRAHDPARSWTRIGPGPNA